MVVSSGTKNVSSIHKVLHGCMVATADCRAQHLGCRPYLWHNHRRAPVLQDLYEMHDRLVEPAEDGAPITLLGQLQACSPGIRLAGMAPVQTHCCMASRTAALPSGLCQAPETCDTGEGDEDIPGNSLRAPARCEPLAASAAAARQHASWSHRAQCGSAGAACVGRSFSGLPQTYMVTRRAVVTELCATGTTQLTSVNTLRGLLYRSPMVMLLAAVTFVMASSLGTNTVAFSCVSFSVLVKFAACTVVIARG